MDKELIEYGFVYDRITDTYVLFDIRISIVNGQYICGNMRVELEDIIEMIGG